MITSIFNTMKSEPLYSCKEDYINTVRKILYVKVSKDKVVGYCDSYGINSWNIVVTKDTIALNFAHQEWELSKFINDGHMGNISTRWLRMARLIKFNNVETGIFTNMVMDYDFNLLSKPPKKSDIKYREAIDNDRNITNRLSRARYHNEKAQERLEFAENSNNMDSIPMDDIFKLQNVSERRKLIAYFGMDTVLASLETETVDTNQIDGRQYSLVTIAIPDNSDEGYRKGTYLRMVNPSTDEIHFEGVPNVNIPGNTWGGLDEETVISALAWRDSDPEGEYQPPVILT
jgi:hypothetical protein